MRNNRQCSCFISYRFRLISIVILDINASKFDLQVDKLLSIDNSSQNSTLQCNNILTPSTPASNYNNNVKNELTLKSGVSLDAAALAKQAMPQSAQNKKYANINTSDQITSNGIIQNDPFANHVGSGQKAEINCQDRANVCKNLR